MALTENEPSNINIAKQKQLSQAKYHTGRKMYM